MPAKESPTGTMTVLWSAITAAGFLYVLGFLITNSWLGEYGLVSYSLSQARYAAAGILYLTISLLGGLGWIPALLIAFEPKSLSSRWYSTILLLLAMLFGAAWMVPATALIWLFLFARGDLLSISQVLPWIGILMLAAAVIVVALAKRRPQAYRDRVKNILIALAVSSLGFSAYSILAFGPIFQRIVTWSLLNVLGLLLATVGWVGLRQTREHLVVFVSGLLIVIIAVLAFGNSLYETIPARLGGGVPQWVRLTLTPLGCQTVGRFDIETTPLSTALEPPCITEGLYLLDSPAETYIIGDAACLSPTDGCDLILVIRKGEVVQLSYER